MSGWYYANVTVHVLAAMLWLGGMLFLGVVGAPVLRAIEPQELRQQLFHRLGLRFRTVGWVSIGILIVTGTINLQYRGLLHGRVLASSSFWGTGLGTALALKLVAVTAMLIMSAMHDFVIGPRAGRETPGTPAALRLRRRALLLARVNALVGIVLVVAAVRLARGG